MALFLRGDIRLSINTDRRKSNAMESRFKSSKMEGHQSTLYFGVNALMEFQYAAHSRGFKKVKPFFEYIIDKYMDENPIDAPYYLRQKNS